MYQVYHNLFEKPIYFLWGIGKLAGPLFNKKQLSRLIFQKNPHFVMEF